VTINVGSIILIAFGALWLVLGVRLIWGFDWRALLALAVFTGVLLLGAVTMSNTPQHLSPTALTPATATPSGLAFGIVSIIEFALIFVAVFLFRAIGRPDLILPAVAMIVGLHFIPLATIFNMRAYYFTGAAIIVGVLLSFAAPTVSVRQAIACIACGGVLWVTSVFLLIGAR